MDGSANSQVEMAVEVMRNEISTLIEIDKLRRPNEESVAENSDQLTKRSFKL